MNKNYLAAAFVAVAVAMAGLAPAASASSSTAEPPSSEDALLADLAEAGGLEAVLSGRSQLPGGDAAIATSGVSSKNVAAAATWVVVCTPKANNPHVSRQTGPRSLPGVIFKTTVTCVGSGPHPAAVTVRVRGLLNFMPAENERDTDGTWRGVLRSDYTQSILVNGKKYTFYTPMSEYRGAVGRGFYRGTGTTQIIVPAGLTSGSNTSGVFWLTL